LSDDPQETRAPASAAAGLVSEQNTSLPAYIGRYRILRLLGEGGMGAVYEAEQEQPRRLVALKVIRAGWTSRDLIRRFQQESQVLARLHHPNIAQIYEAGTADTSFGVQPYFAMELIHGLPLVRYADNHKLSTRQRLDLMIAVCQAVEHAHQCGIVHRDLKPGNILVDETGQPKVLDFGLARATDSDAEAARQTDMGQILGTLAYMSPEQVLADPLAIDTRSDVYALGVILYELLAHRMPYVLPNLLHEAIETIRLSEPAKLSSVDRRYRGDIETIVAKALEKDRERRYQSAAEMANDLSRYLNHEPIIARPASTGYQLAKFARRHKALVTGLSAVFVVLVAGILVSTWQAVRARREQREAERQSAIAQAVNDFLQKDLLAQASAYNQLKPDPDLKVRTALDRAAQKIGGKFKGQPEVEAAIRQTVGETYMQLGLLVEAAGQLDAALALSPHAPGDENPKTLSILADMGKLASAQGKYVQAEGILQKVVDVRRRMLGGEHSDTLFSMGRLAIVFQAEGKYAQAEALNQTVLDIRRRVLGPEHPDTLVTMDLLAIDYGYEGKYAQSAALLEQILEVRRRLSGPDDLETLVSMNNLAIDYRHEGKYAQAEAIYEQEIGIQRRLLGPEHPDTLSTMNNLVLVYLAEAKYVQAEELNQTVLETRRRVLGPEHPKTIGSISNLAMAYEGEGKFAQAEELNQASMKIRLRVLGAAHRETLQSMTNLASDYDHEGKFAQAQELVQQGLRTAPDNAGLLAEYAWILLTAKDHRARRPREALDLARRSVKLAPEEVDLLDTLGLAELRNRLWDEAIATLNKSIAKKNGSQLYDFLFLAMAYHGRRDNAEAEKSYVRGAELARKDGTTDPELRMLWAEVAADLGKPAPKLPPVGRAEAR
jgi:eukaryotic-like serine/threonine-protein kinase